MLEKLDVFYLNDIIIIVLNVASSELGVLPNMECAKERKCTVSRKEGTIGLVSALGVVFEIIKALIDGIKAIGGKESDLRRVLSEECLRARVVKMLVGKPEVVWTGRVIVDHSLSLRERVDNGGYGMIFRQFLKLNPGRPRENSSDEVELAVVQFNRPTTLTDAFKQIMELGFLPAGVEELVALGAQHRELAFKYHIEAFIDSKCSQGCYFEVPILFWAVPGGMTLSTAQFSLSTGDGSCETAILCSKSRKRIEAKA